MCLPNYLDLPKIACFVSLLFNYQSFGQCITQTGAPPAASFFHTGGNGPGTNDLKWTVTTDSITGVYKSAVVMASLPPIYSNSSGWISFSSAGEHGGDKYLFYKMDFNLPCFDLCGKSYDDDNTFCLNLDLFADNSVFEIFVNNVPQSASLGNIPLPRPFNPVNHTPSDASSVSLCKDWKAGDNSIIIKVASSATVAGMMVLTTVDPPAPPGSDTVAATICDGESYSFGGKKLTKTGYYFHSFPQPSGCDSNAVVNLVVNPKSSSIINHSMCRGERFEGYANSGTYTKSYTAANGCDSTSTINLTVLENPQPNLGAQRALCQGDSLVLTPGLFANYAWQDGSTDSTMVVKSPGLYSVTVSNSCGSTKAEIAIVNSTCEVYFPTGFTPNNDGKNDLFRILTHAQLEDYHISITNRWGQKVFESTDPLLGWDGKFMGREQQTGTFLVNCSFKISGSITKRKGTVVLIR